MAIRAYIEEAEFIYGENLVSIDDTHGALHWLAEGVDPFDILLIDDVGQQAQIHVTDLVARPLMMWRLDRNSMLQVEEYWEDWQRYGKQDIVFH